MSTNKIAKLKKLCVKSARKEMKMNRSGSKFYHDCFVNLIRVDMDKEGRNKIIPKNFEDKSTQTENRRKDPRIEKLENNLPYCSFQPQRIGIVDVGKLTVTAQIHQDCSCIVNQDTSNQNESAKEVTSKPTQLKKVQNKIIPKMVDDKSTQTKNRRKDPRIEKLENNLPYCSFQPQRISFVDVRKLTAQIHQDCSYIVNHNNFNQNVSAKEVTSKPVSINTNTSTELKKVQNKRPPLEKLENKKKSTTRKTIEKNQNPKKRTQNSRLKKSSLRKVVTLNEETELLLPKPINVTSENNTNCDIAIVDLTADTPERVGPKYIDIEPDQLVEIADDIVNLPQDPPELDISRPKIARKKKCNLSQKKKEKRKKVEKMKKEERKEEDCKKNMMARLSRWKTKLVRGKKKNSSQAPKTHPLKIVFSGLE